METRNEDTESGIARGKRPRIDRNRGALSKLMEQCSSKEFLSVPLDFIFRLEPFRGKPLLSRVEARTLIQVSELATELDIIIDLSAQALERRVQSRYIQNEIENIPTLWSLHPYLSVHGKRLPNQALLYLQSEITRILNLLSALAEKLKEHAEKNYDMSESLMDFTRDNNSSGHALATEKRILGDIEEELSLRVEHIVSLHKEDIVAYATFDDRDLSMSLFCNRLFTNQNVQGRDSDAPKQNLNHEQESPPVDEVELSEISTNEKEPCGLPSKTTTPNHKGRDSTTPNQNLAHESRPLDEVKVPGKSTNEEEDFGLSTKNTTRSHQGMDSATPNQHLNHEKEPRPVDEVQFLGKSSNEKEPHGLSTKQAHDELSNQQQHCEKQNIARKSVDENESSDNRIENMEDSIDISKLHDETQALGETANTQFAVSILAHLSNSTE
mmetsp:Transcript_7580/g.11573  ORF Transcript_7580/g.11573 Transcript_7580/m.11573 type:complete len:440 (-) Transcript_7580:1832-3151(-)